MRYVVWVSEERKPAMPVIVDDAPDKMTAVLRAGMRLGDGSDDDITTPDPADVRVVDVRRMAR